MRKLFLLLISIPSLLFCQQNFWSHHSLDFKIRNLFQTRPDVIYANNYDILLKSSDYGANWDTIYQGPTPISSIYFNKNFLPEDKIIIKDNSSSSDVMISINSGQDWNILNLPSGVSGYRSDFAIDVDGNIYFLRDTLYYSSNNGETWEEANAPPYNPDPMYMSNYENLLIDSLGTFYISIFYQWWFNGDVIAQEVFYKSEDGGTNWEGIIGSHIPAYDHFRCEFIIRAKDFFAYDGGLRANYHYNSDFISEYRIYPFYVLSAVINSDESLFIVSGSIYVSINEGDTWYNENTGIENLATYSIISDSLEYLYCSTEEGIFKSKFTSLRFITDSMVVFEDTKIADTTFKSVAIVNPYPFTLELDSIVTYPGDFFITQIGSGSIGPLDSIDIIVAYSPTVLGELCGDVFLYFNDIAGKERIFGNSSYPVLIFEPHLTFRYVNVGQSATDTICVANHSLNDIVIDSMYLIYEEEFSIEELTFPQLLEQNDTLVVIATFSPSSVGFKKDTLTIHSNAENSIAKISFYGIGRNPVDVEENDNNVIEFALYQNFPNPFNPITAIKYSVPKESNVKLLIYNSLGEVITKLVDQTKERGNYVSYFNGQDLSSGIYFCRMQAADFVDVKKIILLK
jgi:hypothetical protein